MTTSAASLGGSYVTVDADVSKLVHLRAAVALLARQAGAPTDVVETFELVVSELATNVIQHTANKTVTIAFERTASDWQLLVSGPDELVLSEPRTVPDPAQLTGRGLLIVEAVMDRVELVVVDGQQYVRCIKHID